MPAGLLPGRLTDVTDDRPIGATDSESEF